MLFPWDTQGAQLSENALYLEGIYKNIHLEMKADFYCDLAKDSMITYGCRMNDIYKYIYGNEWRN